MDLLLIIFLIAIVPLLLMLPLWIKILRIKNSKNNILILNIGKSKIITNRKNLLIALLNIGIIFMLINIPFIPFFGYIFVALGSFYLSTRLEVIQKIQSTRIDGDNLKEELKVSLDKIKNSIINIENLAIELEAKKIELAEKNTFANQLDTDIEEKLNEYQSWKNLGEEEKKLFLSAVDKTVNKKGTINFLGIIIGSIILNLVANLIWSLLGNPDKPTLLEFLKNHVQ